MDERTSPRRSWNQHSSRPSIAAPSTSVACHASENVHYSNISDIDDRESDCFAQAQDILLAHRQLVERRTAKAVAGPDNSARDSLKADVENLPSSSPTRFTTLWVDKLRNSRLLKKATSVSSFASRTSSQASLVRQPSLDDLDDISWGPNVQGPRTPCRKLPSYDVLSETSSRIEYDVQYRTPERDSSPSIISQTGSRIHYALRSATPEHGDESSVIEDFSPFGKVDRQPLDEDTDSSSSDDDIFLQAVEDSERQNDEAKGDDGRVSETASFSHFVFPQRPRRGSSHSAASNRAPSLMDDVNSRMSGAGTPMSALTPCSSREAEHGVSKYRQTLPAVHEPSSDASDVISQDGMLSSSSPAASHVDLAPRDTLALPKPGPPESPASRPSRSRASTLLGFLRGKTRSNCSTPAKKRSPSPSQVDVASGAVNPAHQLSVTAMAPSRLSPLPRFNPFVRARAESMSSLVSSNTAGDGAGTGLRRRKSTMASNLARNMVLG